jgi:hypothetical protein
MIRDFVQFLKDNGIDPLIASGLVGVVGLGYDLRRLRSWKNISARDKFLVVVRVTASGMLIALAFLSIVGLFPTR